MKNIFILHPGVATPIGVSPDLRGIYHTGEYVHVVWNMYDYLESIDTTL